MKRLTWLRLALATTMALGPAVVAPPASAAPLDVYTTPGTHHHNGRVWRTACEKYSSSVERCRTEIEATQVVYADGRFTERRGWAFNNLTYKPSPRSQWVGNILATPGEHTVDGRRWKTECDTPWSGDGACRSSIWTDTFHRQGSGYVKSPTWVFNNIVHFRPEPVTAAFCAPMRIATAASAEGTAPEPSAGPAEEPAEPIGIEPDEPAASPGPAISEAPTPTPEPAVTPDETPAPAAVESAGTLRAETSKAVEAASAAGLTQTSPTQLDPVAPATISGRLTPAVADALVSAQVLTDRGWRAVSYGRTKADGSYAIPYSHGSGRLGSAQVQVCAGLPDGATVPSAGAATLTRARLANPTISQTSADQVATTYRAGCPVGPSRLRTVHINQQALDGRIYRGEIVVRSDRADQVAAIFRRTFDAGFPVDSMTNPNAFGGDDRRMMAANNTSAFNCRRVVGNPYAMSPHAYGYAVDVNPVQNPYRDPTGRWWPSTAHVDRTPVVPGQLTETSAAVKAFRAHGWSWFSGWDWHHFERR